MGNYITKDGKTKRPIYTCQGTGVNKKCKLTPSGIQFVETHHKIEDLGLDFGLAEGLARLAGGRRRRSRKKRNHRTRRRRRRKRRSRRRRR